MCPFAVSVFYDLVLNDGSSTILLLNIATGDYVICFSGGTVTGRGTVTVKGGIYTLQHNATDRRVLATKDTVTNRATVSAQLFTLGKTLTISDRNIKDNPLGCLP